LIGSQQTLLGDQGKGNERMASLTVFKFNTPEGADQMLEKVKLLQKEQLITLEDAAIVTWPVGRRNPRPSS
jgi:uncharacterized membrane protein